MNNENANLPSPEPNHDSSELAKHSRMVHFALLTVCILLSVVATVDPKSELQTALTHIREISEATKQWKQEYFHGYVTRIVDESELQAVKTLSSTDADIYLEYQQDGEWEVVKLTPDKPWTLHSPAQSHIWFRTGNQSLGSSRDPILILPKTLSAWKDLWNAIEMSLFVYVTTEISEGKIEFLGNPTVISNIAIVDKPRSAPDWTAKLTLEPRKDVWDEWRPGRLHPVPSHHYHIEWVHPVWIELSFPVEVFLLPVRAQELLKTKVQEFTGAF